MLCYKIVESNTILEECNDISRLFPNSYYESKPSIIGRILGILLLALDIYLFYKKHPIFGVVSSIFTLCAFGSETKIIGPDDYKESFHFIEKAISQFKEKGKQLSK